MFQSISPDAIKRDKNNVPARYYNGKIVLKVAIEAVRNKLEEYGAIRYKVENGRTSLVLQSSEAILWRRKSRT